MRKGGISDLPGAFKDSIEGDWELDLKKWTFWSVFRGAIYDGKPLWLTS
jgi:hypothetical protein